MTSAYYRAKSVKILVFYNKCCKNSDLMMNGEGVSGMKQLAPGAGGMAPSCQWREEAMAESQVVPPGRAAAGY